MSWLSGLLSGSSGTQTQTTTTTPSKDQQSLITAGMPFAQQFASQGGVKLPSQAPIAPFNANQLLGQSMALGATPQQGNIVGAAGQGNQFISSGAALNPETNPGLADAIRFAIKPIQQNYSEQVLPGIARDAVGAGGYGGSREGIAEGIASRGEEQAVGNTAASMTSANYLNALDQMAKGQAVSPNVAGEQTLPATTTSGVGDVQQALQQALESYGFSSNVYGQENPLATAQGLMGLSAGIPGGSTTSTGNVTSQMSPLQMAMGGAGIASGLFGAPRGGTSAMSGIGSALSGAGSSIQSGLSSLLPWLAAA